MHRYPAAYSLIHDGRASKCSSIRVKRRDIAFWEHLDLIFGAVDAARQDEKTKACTSRTHFTGGFAGPYSAILDGSVPTFSWMQWLVYDNNEGKDRHLRIFSLMTPARTRNDPLRKQHVSQALSTALLIDPEDLDTIFVTWD